MKEQTIFTVGLILGGVIIAVVGLRPDLILAVVIGGIIGLVFIGGFEEILKWLEKRSPLQ